jgi:hypothetical protein
LVTGSWYHVAGVYDSVARTLDVYLNGVPDDGPLVGTVTGRQRSSRSAVYVGRRSDLKGFEFAGAVDEVRIYSFALTKEEIARDMRGEVIQRATGENDPTLPKNLDAACGVSSEYEDSRIPGVAATLGVLVAIACFGFSPSGKTLPCLVASFAVGLLLLPLMGSSLPVIGRFMIPLASLVGGISIVVSLRSED